MDMSKRLKAYRQDNLMTQRELASRVGVTPATISRIESGRGKASGLTEAKIEKAMAKPIRKGE